MMPPGLIDLHHHILPPRYVATMPPGAIGQPAPGGRVPAWSPAGDLEDMDAHGIEVALTSISAPGVWLAGAEATAALARHCNEYAADLARAHPGRYGFFASVPLPDIGASLSEVAYAFDALGATGVAVMTNYRDRYVGDPAFVPFWEALNARAAVVFVHPTVCTAPVCDPGLATATLEFPFETARAIASLVLGRRHLAFPAIRFVFCHGGGALPAVARRLAAHAGRTPALQARGDLDVLAALRDFHYDTAGTFDDAALAALRAIAPLERVVFGTDVPFAPSAAGAVAALRGLALSEAQRAAIGAENALRLFPHLR